MVQFNPQQPNIQDSNYIFWSRPIENVKADTSKEILGKGLGETLRGGVEAAKEVTQINITGDVRQQAEPVVDEEIHRLSAVNAAVFGQTGAYDVLTQDNPQNHPQELTQLPSKVDTLVSARANGKLSPSAYDAQIYSIAKNLRSKYPGFRDFVDEQMYRATGVHPANQLVRSLIQDYDSALATKNQEGGKLMTEALSVAGYPGVPEAIRNYQSGKDPNGDALREMVVRGKAYKNGLELDDLRLRNKKANREDTQLTEEQNAQKNSDNLVSSSISTLMLPFNTPMSFEDFQKKLDAGYHPTPEEAQILGNWIDSQKVSIGARLDRQLAGSNIPPQRREEIKKEALSTFDRYQELVDNEHHGLAGYAARMVKGKDEQTAYDLSNTPSSEILRRIKILGDTIGKTGNLYTQQALAHLLPDIQKASQDFLLSETGRTIDPADPKSLDSTFQKWRTLGIGAGAGKAPQTFTGTAPVSGSNSSGGAGNSKLQAVNDAKMYWNYITTLTHMLYDKQSPPEAKVAAAAVLYHQDNQLYLDYFQHDQVDQSGRFIKGSDSMFSQIYGPDAAKAVRTKTPEKWEDFKNQAEFQGGKLIKDNIATLNRVVGELPPGTLGWDDGAHRFVVRSVPTTNPALRTPGMPMGQPGETPLEPAATKVARPVIENINRVLYTLSEGVFKTEGRDIDDAAMQFLAEAGSHTGIPKVMADLIMSGRKKAQDDANVQR